MRRAPRRPGATGPVPSSSPEAPRFCRNLDSGSRGPACSPCASPSRGSLTRSRGAAAARVPEQKPPGAFPARLPAQPRPSRFPRRRCPARSGAGPVGRHRGRLPRVCPRGAAGRSAARAAPRSLFPGRRERLSPADALAPGAFRPPRGSGVRGEGLPAPSAGARPRPAALPPGPEGGSCSPSGSRPLGEGCRRQGWGRGGCSPGPGAARRGGAARRAPHTLAGAPRPKLRACTVSRNASTSPNRSQKKKKKRKKGKEKTWLSRSPQVAPFPYRF